MVNDNDFGAFDEVWARVEGAKDRGARDADEKLASLAAGAAGAMRSYSAAAAKYPRERGTFRALAQSEAKTLTLL
ncbi:MAG: hypothetical protein IK136_03865, partial [Oscillospiraceae bacterium]|nr:hypothetical protein [Oscillospiraceae bacterium]